MKRQRLLFVLIVLCLACLGAPAFAAEGAAGDAGQVSAPQECGTASTVVELPFLEGDNLCGGQCNPGDPLCHIGCRCWGDFVCCSQQCDACCGFS